MRARVRAKLLHGGTRRDGDDRITPATVRWVVCLLIEQGIEYEARARLRKKHHKFKVGEVRQKAAKRLGLRVSSRSLKRWCDEFLGAGLSAADGMNGDLVTGLRDGHGRPTQHDFGERLLD